MTPDPTTTADTTAEPDTGTALADDPRDATDAVFTRPDVIEEGVDDAEITLFDGDDGRLTLPQRQCLVRLLKNFTITRRQDPRDWEVLTADPGLVKSRLNDLLLDLHLDVEGGVAYKIQVRSEGSGHFPPLLHDATYTREETILLVYLRQKRLSERANGHAHVVVQREECLEQVALYRPRDASDLAGDRGRAERALETAMRIGVLVRTSDPERFTISAVIESLLPLDRLKGLLAWFREQNSPTARYAAARLADEHDDDRPDDGSDGEVDTADLVDDERATDDRPAADGPAEDEEERA